ncbi:TPA: filamentous hemagglutinin N-terminal domain-containing protein [Enterobacter sichuanensis]|nr:filamentous hemagglutinin N-terminal domain-containing protein [Enterobacter sichuanensis]HEM8743827.1 filamentous hemagglutinin N-terminal domain-containing protein [Enterobacter sichuanensis]HEM8746962.1 filamentous hemagglutinin N-terminal domain-containing protein [Enterobacter sichuanensis]
MNSKKNKVFQLELKWHPVAASVLLALPFVAHTAEINIKNGVVYSAGNVPVININKANDKGLSHNVYDKLNVDKNGLIFNNSTTESNTVLAGKVQGNSNLTSGSAKVILNEVTSKNASAINGMMEVAGDKADLIIANPNGITVNGGGSINTGKLTLTTGTPDIQNDQLAGYSVNGGTITLGKLNNASPTEILSRNVVVTDKVSAGELNVVAGNNYVNAAGQVTGSVTAAGIRNANSIDVAALGGMYANKITLVSTENGVGVRNQGIIAGGVNGVNIDANGQLLNNNARIESSGQINIKTNGALNNTTGDITSVGTIALDTNKNTLVNSRSGNISTMGDLYVNSGAIDNTNGKMAAAGMLAADTNNNTLTNYGKGKTVGIEAGIVALKTGTLNNSNGQIKGGYVGLESAAVNNNSGLVDALGDVNVVSGGNVDNNRGMIRSAGGFTKIAAKGTVNNGATKTADTASDDSLGIIAEKGVQIAANSINNNGGQMASNGDISLESAGTIDNYSGKLNSNSKVIAKAASMRNDNGGVAGRTGVSAQVGGNITNYIGVFSSEEGDVELAGNDLYNRGGFIMGQNVTLKANAGVNNNTAFIVASKVLSVTAGDNIDNSYGTNFGSAFGTYFGMPQQNGGMVGKEGVSLSGNTIYNNQSRIISEDGPLKVLAKGNIDNSRALLVSGGDASIKAGGSFNNNYSTTYSMGDLAIEAYSLSNYSNGALEDNNATGVIAADSDLTMNVASSVTNYGWISSLGDAILNILNGSLTNRNTLSAEKSLTVSAQSGVENQKNIAAGGALVVNTQRGVTNSTDSNMVGDSVTISAVYDVNNRGNIVADNGMVITTKGNLYNDLNMVSYGDASFSANNIDNNASTIKADGNLTLTATGNVNNSRGKLIAEAGDVTITAGGTVDNYYGKIESGSDLVLKANRLNNDYGRTAAYGNIDLALMGYFDNNRGSLLSQAGDIKLSANIVDNNNGLIAGENVAVETKSTVYNNTAMIVANKKLSVNAAGNVENRDGNNFVRYHGETFGVTGDVGGMIGREGVSVSGQNVYNNNSSIIADNGALSVLSKGTLDNTRAMLVSGADAIVKAAGTFYNNYATLWSAGNLDVTAGSLSNYSDGSMANNTATGVIASDKNLNLTVDNSVTNYGWISGKGDVNVNVLKGTLYNRNTLSADNALAINALNGVENFKDIVAGTNLKMDTQRHITNNSNSNILAQNIALNAGADISNRGNIVSDYTLSVKTTGNIYNYLNMLSYGVAGVAANNVTNSGQDAVFGGLYGMELITNKVTNTGTIVGM